MSNLDYALPYALILARLLMIVITFFVGRWLARKSKTELKSVLQKQELQDSIVTVIVNLTFATIWLLTIIMILALLGVPLQALLTGVAVLLIILGITLRESLGNFAATIIFALFKPFAVGDLIETVQTMGVVKEIQIFNTVLLSYDNKVHIFPNGLIQSSGITNLTKMGAVRMNLEFSISYKDDMQKAKEVLSAMLAADERVQQDPPPVIFVKALSEGSVDIAVWPFIKTSDYFPFMFDVLESGKLRLEEAGMTIPFPQRDVHFYRERE